MRTLSKFLAGAVFALGLSAAASAQASTLFTYGAFGPVATDSAVSTSFLAGAGAGNVAFDLVGTLSLDGQNFYEDDFTLSVNNVAVLKGTYDLGGGGGNVTFFSPTGTNISTLVPTVFFGGGKLRFSVPVNFTSGLNTVHWGYASLPGPSNAGFQGLGDEGWGLDNINITGNSAVPEPGAWALMIFGFGAAGAAIRRRRALAAA